MVTEHELLERSQQFEQAIAGGEKQTLQVRGWMSQLVCVTSMHAATGACLLSIPLFTENMTVIIWNVARVDEFFQR